MNPRLTKNMDNRFVRLLGWFGKRSKNVQWWLGRWIFPAVRAEVATLLGSYPTKFFRKFAENGFSANRNISRKVQPIRSADVSDTIVAVCPWQCYQVSFNRFNSR